MSLLSMAKIAVKRAEAAMNCKLYDPDHGIVGNLSTAEAEEVVIDIIKKLVFDLKTAYDSGRAMDRAIQEELSKKGIVELYKKTLHYTLEEESADAKEWRRFWEGDHE